VEDAAGRQRVEDALESFLLRLPPWRGGQRDVGRSVSMSPERNNGRGKGGGDGDRFRARSRSRSRRRPSPVPAKARKGSMFDIGPGRGGPEQLRDTKEKKEKKEKRRSPSRRKASSGRDSRSPSRPKKRKEVKRDSRSASHGKKRKGDKDKDKDRGKDKDRDRSGSHRSQRDRKHKARDRKSASPRSPSRGSGTGERRAGSTSVPPADGGAAEKPPGGKADEDVPEWLTDLFQAPGNVGNGGGQVGGLLRPRMPHREVIVPQQLVARLIGKGGEVIMGICNATGADVKIRQETKDMGYSLAIITGHSDAMDTAEAMVRQKLGV